LGQRVKTIKEIRTDELILQRENLNTGIYYIVLSQENRIVDTEKVIIN
jgi:hypothetical protein